jgi:hypothetical protein
MKNVKFKHIKTIFAVFVFLLLANIFVLAPAKISLAIDTGLDKTAEVVTGIKGDYQAGDNYFPTKIGQIIGVLLSFVGTIFFILIIYGGFLWMTARGNEQDVTKAKDLITSAIIGLVIVLAAYVITTYIGTML